MFFKSYFKASLSSPSPEEMSISAINDREDDDTALRYADIVAALSGVNPLARSNPEMISKLRTWAASSARPANSPEIEDTPKTKSRGGASKKTIQMMA